MIEAVCGFYFDEQLTCVALIRKQKPAWQKGKLNGVGGKVEPNESCITAMVREFEEETGLKTTVEDWARFFVLEDRVNDFRVFYYRAFGDPSQLRTMEDEEIEVVQVTAVPTLTLVHNLVWLIPMALDANLTNGRGEWID